jgi:glycosyltransferase involved in cell wall biosynthesis
VGFVSNDSLPRVLGRHNLYVSLIDYDGVSASLLEAMAVGLLPIVPDHRANRDWINDGENGLLLKDVSAETIAQAIVRAIHDKDLRNAAWAQNPGIVRERADLHRNAQSYYSVFRNIATA